jgi:hypothetical protein
MIVAPVVAALTYVLLIEGLAMFLVGGWTWKSLPELLPKAVVVCFYTYPLGWALGLRLHFAYQHARWVSLRAYVAGGLVGGLGVAWLLFPFGSSPEGASIWRPMAVIWGPVVVAIAASCGTFWRIAVRDARVGLPGH